MNKSHESLGSQRAGTLPLTEVDPPVLLNWDDATPVLLVAGSASDLVPASRIVKIADTLKIERGFESSVSSDRWTLADPHVSRSHATVEVEPSAGAAPLVTLSDHSMNGTWVNGEVFRRSRRRLKNGDVLRVGDHAGVFRFVSAATLDQIDRDARAPVGPVPSLSPRLLAMTERLRISASNSRSTLLCSRSNGMIESYAHSLHRERASKGAFVSLDAATVPREEFWAELFDDARTGPLHHARCGTLLVKNADFVPPRRLEALLRLLAGKTSRWWKPCAPDVRLVVSAENDGFLEATTTALLGGQASVVPPLSRRKEDLGALCSHFLARLDPANGPRRLDPDTFFALVFHAWPGDVDELEEMLARAQLLAGSGGEEAILLSHLPEAVVAAGHRGVRSVYDTDADVTSVAAAQVASAKTRSVADLVTAFVDRHGLSDAEASVLRLDMIEHLHPKEIAHRMGTSVSTVQTYRRRIRAKTGCPDWRAVAVSVMSALG
jgi:DNA-binding CsgD family transcriptional regulator/pSer/pThr/pTyr-binding forkhead associated (FHA) protein